MAVKVESILDTVGNTPVVRIKKLAPAHVRLYAKIEAFNPMGSVKDRLALGIIEDAERSGKLAPGQTVIEATSGNTGIGLAMVCAEKGYPLVVTMAENFSVERRKLMRFLGAKVVLTPAALKGSGMLAKAVELAEKHGWFLCRQFENEANANIHSRTTAPEILEAFAGERLDYFVTGFGTGGTLKGVARTLRERSPGTKVIVCEPDNSQTLGSGIPQARAKDGSPAASHPNFRPHLMQGWAPDFIPKLTEDAVAQKFIDRIVPVNGADALRLSRDLARKEGIFVGISGGATLAGALQVAADAPAGSTILCMMPDTGERYLSTPLFADIPADMTAEEIEIAQSTPNYRFDAPAPAAATGRAGAGAGVRGCGGVRRARHPRSRAAGDVVRARMVRVLLVGAAHVRKARHRVPLRRSRFRGISEGRPRRQGSRGAHRAHIGKHDSAGFRRRRIDRRRDRRFRFVEAGQAAVAARTQPCRFRPRFEGRSVLVPADVAASEEMRFAPERPHASPRAPSMHVRPSGESSWTKSCLS